MLIRAYGEFWSPDFVDWGKRGGQKGVLKGTALPDGRRMDSYAVDMWEATAVYCLYIEYRPVYVGKASTLGTRLRNHLRDRHVGRWDMFSFYSLSKALRSGAAGNAGTRYLSPETVLDTVEAVTIRIYDPPLNRRYEAIPNVVEIEQEASTPRAIRSYLEEIITRQRAIEGSLP